jgi:hypothetical protein
MKTPRFARPLALAGLLAAACGDPAPELVIPENSLTRGEAFVSISRNLDQTAAVAVRQALTAQGRAGEAARQSFYLAISKQAFQERWFLSAYLRNFEANRTGIRANSLGTRVITLEMQNDKVFLFDARRRADTSLLVERAVPIETFPIITGYAPFERLPGADGYVLVDPAGGLNRFQATGDALANATLGGNPIQFEVTLSYSTGFRRYADGAGFEQVFTGYADGFGPGGPAPGQGRPFVNDFQGSGTLAIAIRRHVADPGFQPRPMNTEEPAFFFPGESLMAVTDLYTGMVAKWNIKPGAPPIRWAIAGLEAYESRPELAGYDLFGAIKQGIESWNQAFGFRALEAVRAEAGDDIAADDRNVLLVDNIAGGFAFANWRSNPETGEIRGASVYYSGGLIDVAHMVANMPMDPIDPGVMHGLNHHAMRKPRLGLGWSSLGGQPLCDLDLSAESMAALVAVARDATPLSPKEKAERFLANLAAHEVGHTLGLRHNFKGSLVPPSSSVMDYLDPRDMWTAQMPGAYDVAAIQYLYRGGTAPAQPFCGDETAGLDPECERHDHGASPLDFHAQGYTRFIDMGLAGQLPADVAPLLPYVAEPIMNFVRNGTPELKLAAWELLGKGMAAPLAAGSPAQQAWADSAMRSLIDTLFVPPSGLDETIEGFPSPKLIYGPTAVDAGLEPLVIAEIGEQLANADGIRSFETRRVMVRALKARQTVEAQESLLRAQSHYQQLLPTLTGRDEILTRDLLITIDEAVAPYFEQGADDWVTLGWF